MPIVHSQNIMVVDREGRIRGAYDALTEEGRKDLHAMLAKVVAEPPPTDVFVPVGRGGSKWIAERRTAQAGAGEVDRGAARFSSRTASARAASRSVDVQQRRHRQVLPRHPLRSRHGGGGRGRRWRRPSRSVFRQSGRQEQALPQSRRRAFRRHHGARGRRRRRPRVRRRVVRRHRQRRRRPICSSRPCERATSCSGTTATANSRTSRRRPASAATEATPPARSSSTTTATDCSICSSPTSASTRGPTSAPSGRPVGQFRRRVRRPSASRAFRDVDPVSQPRRRPLRERDGVVRAGPLSLVGRSDAVRLRRRRPSGPVRAVDAGPRRGLVQPRRRAFREPRPPGASRPRRGARWA